MNITVSRGIEGLIPYTTGKPIEELERELGIKGAVKLASNENPLGPSKKALDAIAEAAHGINRYPDGGGYRLKEALSGRYDVVSSQIILGNGSNEIIDLLVRTFMIPGDEAIAADLTFIVYKLVVTASGGKAVIVPLKDEGHDLAAMASMIGDRTRLLFIANPNNPTGTIVTEEEVYDFLERVPDNVIVVFDEAYKEYVTSKGFPDTLGYLRTGRNIVILRTFSKIYGLAGLRIGFGIAKSELVNYMNRVRQPFNTNSLAQRAALCALNDDEHIMKSLKINEEGKKYYYSSLKEMGLRYIPTEANFIYFGSGRDGKEIYNALLKEGIIVRHIEGSRIRVTIGLPEDNRRFIYSLKKVLSREGVKI
ncbi:MAG: histidinol-phosphate transaminase [Nitrospirota bacterium]